MDVASYEAGKVCMQWFQGEKMVQTADYDLAEWPAERVCDLTRQ